jgi:hypothetical protein
LTGPGPRRKFTDVTNEPSKEQQEAEAAAANDSMVRQMESRRQNQTERRSWPSKAVPVERRRTCSYCYQSGDHPTPDHCRRALER